MWVNSDFHPDWTSQHECRMSRILLRNTLKILTPLLDKFVLSQNNYIHCKNVQIKIVRLPGQTPYGEVISFLWYYQTILMKMDVHSKKEKKKTLLQTKHLISVCHLEFITYFTLFDANYHQKINASTVNRAWNRSLPSYDISTR